MIPRAQRNIFFCFIFLAFFTSGSLGSELAVSTMGTGWLVPDELTDIIYNPARITALKQDVLDIKWGLQNEPDGINMEYDYTNAAPQASYLKRFGDLVAGFYLGREAMVTAGMKAGDNLSFGLNVNMWAHDSHGLDRQKYWDKGIALGAEYILENSSFGVNLEYRSAYEKLQSYIAGAALLYEMKTGAAGRIRALESISYSLEGYGIDTASIPGSDNYGFLGRMFGSNKTGVSYSDNFGGVNYCVSALNEWNFKDDNGWAGSDVYPPPVFYNIYKDSRDADTFVITLGCETSVFVDWIKFRVGYELLRAEYRYLRVHKFNTFDGEKYLYDGSYTVLIIPSPNSTTVKLGLGFKIGKDMDLDLKFGPNNVYAFDNTGGNAGNYSYNDFFDFNAEFTARF